MQGAWSFHLWTGSEGLQTYVLRPSFVFFFFCFFIYLVHLIALLSVSRGRCSIRYSCGQSRNGLLPYGSDSLESPHVPAALSLILVLK